MAAYIEQQERSDRDDDFTVEREYVKYQLAIWKPLALSRWYVHFITKREG